MGSARINRNRVGFTLIELMIVISIIGVLSMVLMPAIVKLKASAAISGCQSQMKNIATSIESFIADKGTKIDCGGGIVSISSSSSCEDIRELVKQYWPGRYPHCPINPVPYSYVDSVPYYIYCPSMSVAGYGGTSGSVHFFSQSGTPKKALYYSESSGFGTIDVP